MVDEKLSFDEYIVKSNRIIQLMAEGVALMDEIRVLLGKMRSGPTAGVVDTSHLPELIEKASQLVQNRKELSNAYPGFEPTLLEAEATQAILAEFK